MKGSAKPLPLHCIVMNIQLTYFDHFFVIVLNTQGISDTTRCIAGRCTNRSGKGQPDAGC